MCEKTLVVNHAGNDVENNNSNNSNNDHDDDGCAQVMECSTARASRHSVLT